MRKQAYTIIVTLVLVGFIGMSSAKAQSLSAQLTASIPFEFNVGSKTLPAGEYLVRTVNPASPNQVMQISSRDGKDNALVQTIGVTRRVQGDSCIVFSRRGDRYYLAQAWLHGDTNGLEATGIGAHRDMENQLAGVAPNNKRVTLTARR